MRRKIGSAIEVSVEDLQTAADFAAKFGGFDKLSSAVTALRQFQVK